MQKPNLSFWKLWNLSFGFFGVQIAYALQTNNVSRIFTTLGANPKDLSFFWLLPPLMGMIVQPIVGSMSDKTWNRLGRRLPYLLFGAIIAVIVMALLPNSGSLGITNIALTIFGWATSAAMLFGLFMLMFLDTSLNMAMQPFKMLVGDMVNEEQKTRAYSIQSFLCNAGSVIGYVLPFCLTYIGLTNTAEDGVVPPNTIWSFYIGAFILSICVIYSLLTIKEWNPKEYAEYNSVKEINEEKTNWFTLLKKAPSTFWQVSLVQFFCWAGFLFMWSYTSGTIAGNCFDTPTTIKDGALVLDSASKQYQSAGDWAGVLYAIQALGSVAWATVIPRFKNRKFIYSLSLVLGGIGFISMSLVNNQYIQIIPFLLIGCAWAAMLALPFTFITNALEGYGHMGTYLGLFNCAICLPQIIASIAGKSIMPMITIEGQVPPEPTMIMIAGVLLVCGAATVFAIKEK